MNKSDGMDSAAAKAGVDDFDKLRIETDGDTNRYIWTRNQYHEEKCIQISNTHALQQIVVNVQ